MIMVGALIIALNITTTYQALLKNESEKRELDIEKAHAILKRKLC